jgi:hypothetical protein
MIFSISFSLKQHSVYFYIFECKIKKKNKTFKISLKLIQGKSHKAYFWIYFVRNQKY